MTAGKRFSDFLIIGVMKCGTTAAAFNISKHPGIRVVDREAKRGLNDEISRASS